MPGAEHATFEQQFSELYDETLPAARARALGEHLAGCARCRAEYAAFRATMAAITGVSRTPAPAEFEEQITRTIHRRSAGRFFGKKALGDRVPYGVIAAVALLVLGGVALLLHFSATGSVHDPLRHAPSTRPAAPGARDVVPLP